MDYDIGKAFEAIERELMESMIRNLRRHRAEEEKEDKQWTMWQVEQLKALEEYKKRNREKYGKQFKSINKQIEVLIQKAREDGNMEQEIKILEAIKNGLKVKKNPRGASAEFFKINDRKLDALIKATVQDMQKAETAVLRMANDQYRKIIFNAQVYANTGAGTYEQAVDMATKDFLAAGINCIEYANGSRHSIKEYANMATRTAAKRAYLQGEGEMRQSWGIHTVIVNKRGNPCPKCLPFCGKVLIDDVWSGGSKDGISSETGLKYPLMSAAVAAGLYHPNCKDTHTTYFEGISTPPDNTYTKEELNQIYENYQKSQKQQYAKRQEEKFGRLAEFSLDEENQKRYAARRDMWGNEVNAARFRGIKGVANDARSGIINTGIAKEVADVHTVGRIDREIYKCITNDIVTDEVIITDERIRHIKERHPNDYEQYYEYLKQVVEQPDYIVETPKPNTALILKEIVDSDERQFKTVLRLKTSEDNPEFKNSIITFMKINEKEWSRLIRNKKILYKRE